MSPLYWLVIAFAVGVIEIVSPNFFFLWFALAALIIAACLGLGITMSLNAQLLGFAVLSLIFIIFTRPLIKKLFPTKQGKSSNVNALINKEGLSTTNITPLEYGQIKLDGEIWTAFSEEEISPGTIVKVIAVEGVKLKVIKN